MLSHYALIVGKFMGLLINTWQNDKVFFPSKLFTEVYIIFNVYKLV